MKSDDTTASETKLSTLKVAMIVPGALNNFGGVELCAARLIASMNGWGIEPVVVWRKRKGGIETGDTAIKDVGLPGALERFLFGLRASFAAIRSRPDVIHVQGAEYGWALPFLFATLIRRSQRPIIIVTSHGFLSSMLRETSGVTPSLARKFYIRLVDAVERNVYRVAKMCCPVSEHVERELARKTFDGAIRTIPNAINTDVFKPGSGDVSNYLAWTGRDAEYKNPVAAIQMMDALNKEFPDATMKVAGGFPEEHSGTISNEGRLPQEQLAALLQGSYLFISTSFYEGDPLAVKEALACGTPAVVTAAASQGVIDGVNGLVVDRQLRSGVDIAEFSRVVKRVFRDPALRNTLAEGAIRTRDDFSPDVERERYRQAYLELIDFD